MIRLAIIVDTLLVGGAQKLVASFVEAQTVQDVEVTVISLSTASSSVIVDALQAAGIQILIFPSRSLFGIWRMTQLIRFFKSEKFDLIHTHLTYSSILGCLASFFSKTPVIVTLHSIASDTSRFSFQLNLVEEVVVRSLASRITAVGFAVADANRNRFAGRIIEIIPNGTPVFNCIPSDLRRKIRSGFSENGTSTFLISVGRFTQAKGYDDLIDAFCILHERDPKTVLLMVGSGSLFEQIKAKISAMHLNGSVKCLGERNDIPQLLMSSDIYVSSSHREGLPVAILEAMMAGLPIISTTVGDIPHVVTKDIGYLVPPHHPERLAEALFKLINSPDKILAMGKAARNRAIQEYSVDVWATRMMSLYTDAIAANR
jgi:glycosyltransferase involved in cell wall biosynthesis